MCRVGFGSAMAVVHGFVHNASHLWPIMNSSHGAIYATLSEMIRKRRMAREVEMPLSK